MTPHGDLEDIAGTDRALLRDAGGTAEQQHQQEQCRDEDATNHN